MKDEKDNMREITLMRDIIFIDSFKFMVTSLDSLVNNLPNKFFRCISKFYMGEQLEPLVPGSEILHLLKPKGVYPMIT